MLSLFTIIYGILNWRYNTEGVAVLNGVPAAQSSYGKKLLISLNPALQSAGSIRLAMGVVYFAVIAFLVFKLLSLH